MTPPEPARVEDRRRSAVVHVALALLAYVPTVLSAPGRVVADTKSYLYIDPGELLRRAVTMWDPNVGMGTVTHQTIGYLFPMGPYYWALEQLGVPDWLAQRIWLGSILFAAGAGVLFLARTLGWRGAGPVVAALAFQLSPYSLDYATRISVILLPWAALPWLVGLAIRAGRTRSWRHAALFALVVLAVGGVNATALLFAGLAPVLWFPFAVWGTRELPLRHAIGAVARIGLLTSLVSLWWVAGLWAQGAFGLEILRYTETVEAVARTSTVPEVLRGLGYWFFYGNDKLGPWIEPARQYTQQLWLIAVTFAIPILALAAAAVVRWKYRAYFALLIVVGTVIAVGAHPYDDPSPLGGLFKELATGSTVGLALRSTARAVPLIALGVAVLLGAGVTAVAARVPRRGALVAAFAGLLAIAGLPPLFTGDLAVSPHLDRPEELPDYWLAAADFLDNRDGDAAGRTRILEIPGSDFAAYRWGNTVDPITPYLLDRPYVARELIPYGSPATADLLNALDRRLQEGVFEPAALARVARLISAGDAVLRADLQHERFRTPRPQVLWLALTDPRPDRFGPPVGFGPRSPNRPVPQFPLIDEIELGIDPGAPHPPKVAVFPVDRPVPIVHAHAFAAPVLLAGSGEGVVDAAAAGVPIDRRALFYAASFADDPASLDALLDGRAHVVVTDTNRLRARRWGTVRENTGFTEQPGDEMLVDDPADARLPLFPDAGFDSYTTAEIRGAERVTASHYGNPVSFTPEDRPVNAFDGNEATGWRVGAFADVEGERIRIELDEPVTTDEITLLQPLTGARNRWITEAEVRLDGATAVEVALGDESRTRPGQRVDLGGRRTFSALEVVVRQTNLGKRARYDGLSGVGFAEIRIPGVHVEEVIRLPRALLDHVGDRLADHPLTLVMSRLRADPAEPVRFDEEPTMVRSFTLPAPVTFGVGGDARLSAHAPDDVLDRMLGLPGRARSSGRLPGDVGARAAAAVDDDLATAWSPGLLEQVGHWVEFDLDGAQRLDRLDLVLVTDGRHSIPTRLRISAGDETRVVDVPDVPADTPDGRTRVRVDFEPLDARTVRITIDDVRELRTRDYFSESPVALPVAIAEIDLPVAAQRPVQLDTGCRSDLLTLDGRPVPVRLEGTLEAALERRGLEIVGCGPPLTLDAGRHELRTSAGPTTGIDIDRVVLSSPAAAAPAPTRRPSAPAIEVVDRTRTSYEVRATEHGGEPFWLVLGQSHNPGWKASVDGESLGEPILIDGYANGWLVDPNGEEAVTISLDWWPQRVVWVALAVSALAVLACLGIAVAGWRRAGRTGAVSLARQPARPVEPALDLRARRRGGERRHLVVGAAVALGTAVAAGPAVGLAVGVVALLSLVPALRRLPGVLAPLSLLAAATYIVVQQARYDFPPDFAWPANFELAHPIGWAAVAFLALDQEIRRAQAG